jgi:uncharacterized membrane protein YoaK (UPF0700 family)
MPDAPAAPASVAPATSPEEAVAYALSTAAALSCAGGMLDAFLYRNYGHVFAGAMTGNTVLFGLSLLSRNGHAILHHGTPILAFLAGIWAAQALLGLFPRAPFRCCAALELLLLLLTSVAGSHVPELAMVALTASAAGLQTGAFGRADSQTYGSTYISGDMRTLAVGLFQTLRAETRATGMRITRDLGTVLLAFLVGAAAAAGLAPRMGDGTLWLPSAVLAVVLLRLSAAAAARPAR